MSEKKYALRVGILLGPNGRGGMERQANYLTKGLLKKGIPTRVIFNSRPSLSRQSLDWASVPYQYLWRFNPIKEVAQLYLGWLLWKHRINILHVFFWGNMEFAVGAMKWSRRTVFIGSQRDTDFVTYENIAKRLKKTCASYNYLTCNTQITHDLMKDMDIICPSNKVRVIYNGIVVPAQDELQNEQIDSKSEKTILFPNRLFSYKNPLLFIDACAMVFKKIPNFKIIVCGCGDLENSMKERSKELGIMEHCDFRGSVLPEEIPYKEANLVVNCSSSLEGMSNSLMEALAHGVPVISTKVGGNSELLKNYKFGRLVDINDKGALSDAIYQLLTISIKKRESLKKEAREYILKNFSIDKFVNDHIEFYNNVLSETMSD